MYRSQESINYEPRHSRDSSRENKYGHGLLPYKIQVSTTKKFGSGTDANVHLKIYGSKSSTERIKLTKSQTHKNPFESGNIDVFDIASQDLGDIVKLK